MLDFELRFEDHYQFDESLRRVEINGAAKVFDEIKNWESFLLSEIERVIEGSDARIIIVDNITYLTREGDKSKFALPLMQRLNDLKNEHSLSILVMAHTPKRDESRPISINDLAGSKTLANFADSIFAIGKSQKEEKLRYLKQIKARNTEVTYHQYNVAVMRLEKRHNFFGFDYVDCEEEIEHLSPSTQSDRQELKERVRLLSSQGMTQREIASEVGIALGRVNTYLKK